MQTCIATVTESAVVVAAAALILPLVFGTSCGYSSSAEVNASYVLSSTAVLRTS
jgi:hypothetical protein